MVCKMFLHSIFEVVEQGPENKQFSSFGDLKTHCLEWQVPGVPRHEVNWSYLNNPKSIRENADSEDLRI